MIRAGPCSPSAKALTRSVRAWRDGTLRRSPRTRVRVLKELGALRRPRPGSRTSLVDALVTLMLGRFVEARQRLEDALDGYGEESDVWLGGMRVAGRAGPEDAVSRLADRRPPVGG